MIRTMTYELLEMQYPIEQGHSSCLENLRDQTDKEKEKSQNIEIINSKVH